MNRLALILLLALGAATPAACGSSDDTPNADLPAASVVRATQTVSAATAVSTGALAVGEMAKYEALEITILSAERTPDGLVVQLQARNPGESTAQLPTFTVQCPAGNVVPRTAPDPHPEALKSPTLPPQTQDSARLLFALPAGCEPATLIGKPVLQLDGKPETRAWLVP